MSQINATTLNYYNQGMSSDRSRSLTNLNSGNAATDDKELRDACSQFETLMVKQMLDSMRKTVHKQGLLGEGSMSEDIFEDMLYDEYAKKMTETARFGLADMLYKQLSS